MPHSRQGCTSATYNGMNADFANLRLVKHWFIQDIWSKGAICQDVVVNCALSALQKGPKPSFKRFERRYLKARFTQGAEYSGVRI